MTTTEETQDRIEDLIGKMSSLKGSTAAVSESFSDAAAQIASFGKQLSFLDDFSVAALRTENSISALNESIENLQKVSENMPIIGDVVDVVSNMNSKFQMMVTASEGLDAPTESFRILSSASANLGRQFGLTYSESENLRDGIINLAGEARNLDQYFSANDLKNASMGLLSAGLSVSKLNDEFSTLNNTMSVAEAALFMVDATGIDNSSAYRNITEDIMEYGLSLEDSMLKMASFSDSAGKTGLSISDIKSSLESAASSFKTLGMSTDFAKPFLEGFVTTLEKVGLGIKNAGRLSASFSSSLMRLANDYGKAYFTFQQGGLDFGGGGGVLGAGIGYRARMLEAEKTGEQGNMALEVAKAMKSTIENMTGGEIITVTEAAESPELQQLFAIQEQLLKDYGISGAGEVDRTLELLKDLDNTQATSKEELKERLDRLNQDTKDDKEKNLSESQKTNAHLSKILTQATLGNSIYQDMLMTLKAQAIGMGAVTRSQMGDIGLALKDSYNELAASTKLDSAGEKALEEARKLSQKVADEAESKRKVSSGKTNVEILLKLAPGAEKLIDAAGQVNSLEPANENDPPAK